MRRWVAVSFACIPLGVVAAVGCEKIIGADFSDRTLAAPLEDAAQCTLIEPIGPPVTVDNNPGVFTIVAAVHTLDFGDTPDGGTPAYKSIGFNLDGRCPGAPPPCQPAAWTEAGASVGANGIDNQVGALLVNEINAFNSTPINSVFLNEQVQTGAYAPLLLFRVTDYNGFDDDSQVTVEVLLAPAIRNPKWDGTDVYFVDPSTATQGPGDGGDSVVGRFVDSNAYVNGFQLVAHVYPGELSLANTTFKLTDVIVSAHLQPVGTNQFTVEGTIAAHGRSNDLLGILPPLTKQFPGIAICENNEPIYDELKLWICTNADSVVDGGATGPNAVCNAASLGVKFVATTVQLGGMADIPDAGPLCDSGTDPIDDSCLIPIASQ
jgi:hypothetical protein